MGEMIALIISFVALIFSVITFLFNAIHKKKKDTLDAFSALQSNALDGLYYYTEGQIKEISKSSNRAAEYKELSLYLSRIEHFCVGIRNGVYNKKIVNKLAGKHLVPLYDKLTPLIEAKRRVPDAGDTYKNFEEVVRPWKEK